MLKHAPRVADEILNEATQCTERLIAHGLPRDEAWNVVAIEVNNALHKLEMTVLEMQRLTEGGLRSTWCAPLRDQNGTSARV